MEKASLLKNTFSAKQLAINKTLAFGVIFFPHLS